MSGVMLWGGSATVSKMGDAEIEALSAAAFAGKAVQPGPWSWAARHSSQVVTARLLELEGAVDCILNYS